MIALALMLAAAQPTPVSPERQFRILTQLKEFTDEQSDPDHALKVIYICQRTTERAKKEKVTLLSVITGESKKEGWNSLQTAAMMHDCLIYSFGYLHGVGAKVVAQALRQKGK